MNKDRIRNWLNIIFMVMAVIGIYFFLQKSEQKHNTGLYIILGAMCVKIVESSMRMIK